MFLFEWAVCCLVSLGIFEHSSRQICCRQGHHFIDSRYWGQPFFYAWILGFELPEGRAGPGSDYKWWSSSFPFAKILGWCPFVEVLVMLRPMKILKIFGHLENGIAASSQTCHLLLSGVLWWQKNGWKYRNTYLKHICTVLIENCNILLRITMKANLLFKCILKLLETISYYPEGFTFQIWIVDFKWIS